ncbi:MAG: NAD-dependent succinate-semialdehyde dehydrogenase [Caulobacteraceae bacterium]|nr:NAD-dependent succinate-semialdehyde dehydrogenase [Caulobacteraceae bacterium]
MTVSPDRIDVSALPTGLHIDGEWRPAASGKTIEVIDPASEQVLARVADGSVEEGLQAVEAAAGAAAAWAATAPKERSEILRGAFELMMRRSDGLAELISLENGKALADSRAEVAYAADFFRWFSGEALRLTGELTPAPAGGGRILVLQQPVGVAVLVTPWNFPAAMATRKLGPALAAGCTCVLKPASATPLTAFALTDILAEAGLPKGVLNVVTTSTPGPVIGAMLQDPRVRKLSFTGSTEVGRGLLKQAAEAVVNSSMELGGNAPFIVFEDADMDAAIEGAMVAKMRNGGQACTSANRFYVHRRVFDDFAARLTDRMAAIKLGDGRLADTGCGALINAEGLRKVETLVADAVERGARILTGGARLDRKGFFYPPTVMVDVPPDAEILREEIFGPVAVLLPFEGEDEVIAAANGTEYGLVGYLYTGDLARGLRVSEALECGMVGVNRGMVSDVAAPFGGVKQSGLGREGGHQGLLAFTEPKYVAIPG